MTVRSQFEQHLYHHAGTVGFSAPHSLLEYLIDLLADRLTKTDIIPEPSFAERYMQLYSCRCLGDIKDFGDGTLFFVSLMPEYGHRRGLDMDYYATLGISAYYTYADLCHDDRYTQLGNWFYHLQKFLNSAIHPNKKLEYLNVL